MADGNGTSVTWRELNLLRETIDAKFAALSDDLSDIKEFIALSSEAKRADRRAWLPPLVAACVSAGIALPLALLH